MTRAVVQTCVLFALGCAGNQLPSQLRGYNIVVEEKDSQSVELARALRARGIKVGSAVRGGSGPTAALIYFMFRDSSTAPARLEVRLADTRSGLIVGASTILLDTVATARARAEAAVRALLAP